MKDYRVYKLVTEAPDDTSALRNLIESGKVKAQEVKALMNMTEGDGLREDLEA